MSELDNLPSVIDPEKLRQLALLQHAQPTATPQPADFTPESPRGRSLAVGATNAPVASPLRKVGSVAPEAPEIGGAEQPKLQPIGSPSPVKPLSFAERQALPLVSPGTPAGSSAFYQNKLERIEDQKDNPWGSAENHPGFLGKLGHVAAKIGNIAGDVLAPSTMALIPGTDLNKQIQEHGVEKNLAAAETREGTAKNLESEEAERAAKTKKTEKETDLLNEPKPKEEEWSTVPNISGANGEPVQQEKHSGQMRVSPLAGATTKEQKPEKQNDFEQYYGGLVKNGTADTPENRLKAHKDWETQGGKEAEGSFMPLYDEKGHVVGAWNPKNGQVRKSPAEGTPGALPGTTGQGQGIATKAATAHSKEIEGYQKVLDHVSMADEAAKDVTGPGDYTILMSFVDATKPSSGFRFTEAERKMIIGARSLGQAATAKYDEYTKGPFLGPEQRTQMMNIIHNAAKQAQDHISKLQPAEATKPGEAAPAGGPAAGGVPSFADWKKKAAPPTP